MINDTCACVLFIYKRRRRNVACAIFILRVRVCAILYTTRACVLYIYIFGITTSIDTRLYYYFSRETILTVKRFLILHIYILCENGQDFFPVLFNFLYCIIYEKTIIFSPCKARIRTSSCSRAVVSRWAPSHVGRRRHRPRC